MQNKGYIRKPILATTLAFWLSLILLSSCGTTSDNNVTEVGNPQGTSTTNKMLIAGGTLQTMNASLTNLADELADLPDTSIIRFVTSGAGDFACSFDRESSTQTCTCPGGGTYTLALESSVERGGGTVSLDTDFTVTLVDCMLTVCDEEITHDGTWTGNLSGSLSIASRSLTVTFDAASTSACGDLTHNTDTDYGFDIAFALDDGAVSASGSLCVEDESLSFADIASLADEVDPDDECSEAFTF